MIIKILIQRRQQQQQQYSGGRAGRVTGVTGLLIVQSIQARHPAAASY